MIARISINTKHGPGFYRAFLFKEINMTKEKLVQIIQDNVEEADEDMIESGVFTLVMSGDLKRLGEDDVKEALALLDRYMII